MLAAADRGALCQDEAFAELLLHVESQEHS